MYSINPSIFSARIVMDIQRRGEPYKQVTLPISTDAELCNTVLRLIGASDGELEEFSVDEAVEERLQQLGVLLKNGDLPRPVGFCPKLLDAATEDITVSSAVRLNPSVAVQSETTSLSKSLLLAGDLHLELDGRGSPWTGFEPPILWVDDPAHGVRCGYQLPTDSVAAIEQLASRERAVAQIEPTLARALMRVNAAGLTDQLAGLKRARDTQLAIAQEHFARDGIGIVRQLLPKVQLAALQTYAQGLYCEGWMETDHVQVPGLRDGVYNDRVVQFFQRQVTETVATVVGAAAKPSYSWLFRYRDQAELAVHVDRPQCEWNASFAVDSEPSGSVWPFIVETDTGTHCVELESGDAVIYRGRKSPHSRPPLPVLHSATLCFLHYVSEDFQGSLR